MSFDKAQTEEAAASSSYENLLRAVGVLASREDEDSQARLLIIRAELEKRDAEDPELNND